jgi:hypothetical protein
MAVGGAEPGRRRAWFQQVSLGLERSIGAPQRVEQVDIGLLFDDL